MLFLANWDQPAWGVQTPSAGPRNSLTTVTRQSCPGNAAGGMYKELPSVLKSVGVSKMECPRFLSLLNLIMFIYNELYLSRSFWSDSIAGPRLGTLRRNLPFSIVKSFWEHYILEFVGGYSLSLFRVCIWKFEITESTWHPNLWYVKIHVELSKMGDQNIVKESRFSAESSVEKHSLGPPGDVKTIWVMAHRENDGLAARRTAARGDRAKSTWMVSTWYTLKPHSTQQEFLGKTPIERFVSCSGRLRSPLVSEQIRVRK